MTNNILCCKQCGNILTPQPNNYICSNCFKVYPVVNGIVLMEDRKNEIDLRIGDDLLDIHKLRNERKYFNSSIVSDVEYYARLHSINFTNFHVELLSPYINNSSIIVDLGCGQLPSINFFPDNGIDIYYGLDLDYNSLVLAKNNFKRQFALVLIKHGLIDIPFPDNSVDIIVSSEVIEHIDNPFEHLKELFRICKEGGYLSLSTPCASMYLYPFNFIYAVRNLLNLKTWFKNWYKRLNAHKYWIEALTWHPGLRPKILRKWIIETGFKIVRHETRLWYYHTYIRLMSRIFSLLEKKGIASSGRLYNKYLELTDKILSLNIPLIKWCGIRQFILAEKLSK